MKVWFVAITTLLLTSSESTALEATGVTNVFVAACAVVEGGPFTAMLPSLLRA
jgi:hypothetical protein